MHRLKILLVMGSIVYESIKEFLCVLRVSIKAFKVNTCCSCSARIEKNSIFKKIKTMLCLVYTDNLCIDCFLKKHNLEEMFNGFENIEKCHKCGTFIKIEKKEHWWEISCKNCGRKKTEWTLNRCLEGWCGE